MKLYTITVTTAGHETYEVKANDEAEARAILQQHNRDGSAPKGRLKMTEEAYGEWLDDEWEIEEDEEEDRGKTAAVCYPSPCCGKESGYEHQGARRCPCGQVWRT